MDSAQELKPTFYGSRKPYHKLKKERFEHIEAAKLSAAGWNFKEIAARLGRSDWWACNLFRQPFFQVRVDSILRKKIVAEPFRDREHEITKKANYLRAAERRPRDSLGRFCG